MPVSPRYRQLPLRTPPLHHLPADDTSSGTTTASLTTYLGDADHPTQLFSPPPTDRTQTTVGPSTFLDGTATDDLSNPSPPAPRRPAFRRHRPSLAHFGSPPRPTIQGIAFCVYFFCVGETIVFADRMFHRQWTSNEFLFDSQPNSRSWRYICEPKGNIW